MKMLIPQIYFKAELSAENYFPDCYTGREQTAGHYFPDWRVPKSRVPGASGGTSYTGSEQTKPLSMTWVSFENISAFLTKMLILQM